MKELVTLVNFIEKFESWRPDNFSRIGLESIYNYFVESEQDSGEEMTLDVIDICCTFTEYENLSEFQNEYGEEYENIEKIREKTEVIKTTGNGFIIKAF